MAKFMDLLKDIKEDLGKEEYKHPYVKVMCIAQQAGQVAKEF